jgi:type I restriction enzyme R subunit
VFERTDAGTAVILLDSWDAHLSYPELRRKVIDDFKEVVYGADNEFGKGKKADRLKKQIDDYLSGEIQLRSKRVLIEQFIEESLNGLSPDGVPEEFESFWAKKKQAAVEELCSTEKLNKEKFEKLIENYQFTNLPPRSGELVEALNYKPSILERKSVITRIGDSINRFIETFIEGMG